MNAETDILFYIFYEDQECSLQLYKYDTVGDLKNEIFKKFGVAPYKQVIECWHKIPESDFNTLQTCCIESDVNELVVYNVENIFSNRRKSKLSTQDDDTRSNNTGTTEKSAIRSFVQYFQNNFNNTGITFRICYLDEAIKQVSLDSNQMRQVLLLYLHNKNDTFAKDFCEQLHHPNIQAMLNGRFFLLCWDIEKDKYKNVLIQALHSRNELKSFDRFVERKISVALLIIPVGNSLNILSVMKGSISSNNFLMALEQAEKVLTNENDSISNEGGENHDENMQGTKVGSKEYQQIMLDMLGDRDYDSFDHFESELLKEKIAFALYGPPEAEDGYESVKKKKIDFLFKIIIEQSNLISKWLDRVVISFIYICMEPLLKEKKSRSKKYKNYDPYCDLTPLPIFILRKCKYSENPCRVFIDDSGRVYHSWNEYLEENKLPKCEIVFPKDGRYRADDNGNVILARIKSPECSIGNDILKGADIATAVGGIASGGVMVAAAALPVVAAAPLVVPIAGVAGAATGVYSLFRSGFSLYDRHKHKESLDFFKSSEARGAYINIVAGALGFVGAGANMAVSKLAAEGFHIGAGATATVNTINIVNLGVGGAGIANASYEVVRNWVCENEKPSLLTIVQLSSSILFFGHAVYNYRSIGTIIEENQANALKDYRDSLRSNRHRKTFTKLLKETIRQNDGNVRRGQAEVIKTVRNIQNKDEVFATLTRSNKAMNRNNVRFAVNNGEITLNGVPIDMVSFNSMEKADVITFLTTLPNKPNPTSTDVTNMSYTIGISFEGILSHSQLMSLALSLAKLFCSTDLTIREKIVSAVAQVVRYLLDKTKYMEALNRIFLKADKYLQLFGMVNGYFQKLINEVENKYNRWLETRNPLYEEPYFCRLSLDLAKRAAEIFNVVTETYFSETKLTSFGLEKLIDYFYAWFANQIYLFEERQERRQQRSQHSGQARPRKLCSECGGYFYTSQ